MIVRVRARAATAFLSAAYVPVAGGCSSRSLSSTAIVSAARGSRSKPSNISRSSRSTRRPAPVGRNDPTPSSSASAPSSVTDDTSLVPLLPSSVEVAKDEKGIVDLHASEAARTLLAVPALVVARQIEMMNIFLGFEQANKYQLMDPTGNLLGYLLEEEISMKGMVVRQLLKRSRPFKATVIDLSGAVLFTINRPFSFINSRIFISVPGIVAGDDTVIGEVQQTFHVYKRRYDYYQKRDEEMEQFAKTDEGLMAWDFRVVGEADDTIASVNRNFTGFAREIFTDTGQYVVRFEGVAQDLAALSPPTTESLPSPSSFDLTAASASASSSSTVTPPSSSVLAPTLSPTDLVPTSTPQLTFDQRAVILASAISIDFDYFSRMSGHGGGMGGMPLWMMLPGMGGGGSNEAPVGAEGGEIGQNEQAGGASDASGYNDGSDGSYDSPGSSSGGGPSSSSTTNEYGDSIDGGQGGETMNDPWASSGDSGGGEDGGTWSWGDLFPSDD